MYILVFCKCRGCEVPHICMIYDLSCVQALKVLQLELLLQANYLSGSDVASFSLNTCEFSALFVHKHVIIFEM